MLTPFVNWLRTKEEGQSMVEYALILALISIAALGVLALVGDEIVTLFTTVQTSLGA
jgi:pilus assembly protein Flp/PilA